MIALHLDVTTRKKSRYEFKIRTGEVSKEVVKGFLITTQQYGFAVEQLNFLGSRNRLSHSKRREINPNHDTVSRSETEATETTREEQDETESEIAETTEFQDVISTVSPLSNPGQIPDIDDVNRLLAEGRKMRAIERIKEEIRNENPLASDVEQRRAETVNQQDTALQAQQGEQPNQDEEDSENQSRPQLRATRARRPPQHYGEVVPSILKKLFYARGEDSPQALFTVTNVSMEEKTINREMLINSREEELKGWREFQVVREVPLSEMIKCNVRPLLIKWVDVFKHSTRGVKKLKSRLCIMGNQKDATKLQAYSPSVSREMVLLALNVIARNGWSVIDVKQAFLQSDELTREVFVLPPQEAGLGYQTVWKLRVAVYGLADASRQWYQTVKRMLLGCGMKEVTGEPSLLYSTSEQGHINGILTAHVDDFLYGGNQEFHNQI